MNRILAAATIMVTGLAGNAMAQTYPDQPPVSPAGIEAQPLPAITPPPESLPQPLQVSPHEGPEEHALDQSLGLAPGQSPQPGVKPSAKEDAAIEARINATAPAGTKDRVISPPGFLQPKPGTMPEMPPTTIVGGTPAARSWEGPEERALDQADPSAGTMAPQGLPGASDSQDTETRRLNGGN